MTRISIAEEIAALGGASKRYDRLYADTGLELGFGRAGTYAGHSHLCFVDVLFSTEGIQWAGGGGPGARLVIAPPRTYLPTVSTGDFVFLKFCPEDRDVVLPDKVEERLAEQQLLSYAGDTEVRFPWYRGAGSKAAHIDIVLRGSHLTFLFSGQSPLTFGP